MSKPIPMVRAEDVKKVLRSVYGDWHQCQLRKAERGIKKGTLCDVCNEMIDATIADLLERAK